MRVSIVTPAFNAARFLAETLDSVRAQTFSDWEMIVIDDGSTDGTAALAEGYAVARDGRIRVVTQPNAGVANARNRGIAETNPETPFIAFLDHDDLWEPGALALLVGALEANPEAVAAHGLARRLSVAGQGSSSGGGDILNARRRRLVGNGRTHDCAPDEPTTFAVLAYDCCLVTPGMALIRRSALEQAGPFDPDAAPCDDWDMWLRLSSRGDIIFVDTVVLAWREHGGNASQNASRMLSAQSDVRRKLLTLPGLSDEQRRLAYTRYRRMFASEERQSARLSLRQAGDKMRRGEIGGTARALAAAALRYGRYAAHRVFWSGAAPRDRGPIPWHPLNP